MTRTETRTPDEIKSQVAKVLDLLRGLQYDNQFEIEDYPIGRNDRGICRVEAEYKAGHGFRLVRTTTDGRGRWNKPHKSQYGESLTLPARDICGFVRDPGVVGVMVKSATETTGAEFCDGKQFVGWVQIGPYGISLRRANYDSLTLFVAPNGGQPPRREPKEYSIGSDVRVMEADTPELIAAYDAYKEAIREVLAFFKDVKAEIKGRAAQPVG